ncbi:small conductance mechanosensitive channel [Paenibacillus sophorae]|uniref:Mechanosensitive ion channel family protein n=1 Tax=Paenibacillus sophorae TaxID=1333845 RepID=A0A1H8TM91_9BACL|nr:mechanosensitive ion channel family protein [Paenibacillus sophorae]QWU16287.1 mechanosensitive ion channel family protein [Paenibacillus sophorae]SEO91975.1 small conductance mechanosensitive channel [Paenibacillus sophorae]
MRHWQGWLLSAGTTEGTVDQAVNKAVQFRDKIWNWVTDADMWANVLFAGLRIIFLFILTRILIKVVYGVIDRSLDRKSSRGMLANTRRFSTVGELLKNTVTIVCNFIMILLILSEFNFKLAPLLASASVLGLAIGFGAQSLVKDVITGFFIILEDQFAVGDVIATGGFKGTVEMIGLRTTKLLGSNGEMYIIPNGTIANVTNYSMANALAVVDVPVKIEQSLEETLGVIRQALEGIEERNNNVVAFPNVLGIQSMSTSEYVVRVTANTLPNKREVAQRQIQSDIKKALEQQAVKEAERAEHEQAEAEAKAQPESETQSGAKALADEELSVPASEQQTARQAARTGLLEQAAGEVKEKREKPDGT